MTAHIIPALAPDNGHIRAVLARLASDHVIELAASHGAFVCSPTAEKAREVFRARRLIKSHLVRLAAESRDGNPRRTLEQHTSEEQKAHDAGAQGVVIKRCGNFPQVLADQAGCPILARFRTFIATFPVLPGNLKRSFGGKRIFTHLVQLRPA